MLVISHSVASVSDASGISPISKFSSHTPTVIIDCRLRGSGSITTRDAHPKIFDHVSGMKVVYVDARKQIWRWIISQIRV